MIDDDALDALLRAAPWMDEDGRRAARYETTDEVALDDRTRLLVVSATGRRYVVPVRLTDGRTVAEAHGELEFDRLIWQKAQGEAELTTARGGRLRFRGTGAPAGPLGRLPFDRGWSSNALSLLDASGIPYVHKTYRRLDEPAHEPELLRLLHGTGRTPEWAGDYVYVDPADGSRHPLGVFYRYVQGDGLDTPLRHNMRSLWPKITAGCDIERTVSGHLRPLTADLTAAGRFLTGFHHDLAARLGGTPHRYPVRDALDRAEDRVTVLESAAVGLPKHAWNAAFTALRAETAALRTTFESRTAAFLSGPAHGDLHLSHLLCHTGENGDTAMTVIDMSTPALSPHEPGWAAQSPVQDLVAVERALEYFAADEAAFESAGRLGVDSLRTMTDALDGTASRPEALRLVFHAADVWRTQVRRLLLGPASADPLRRLLYLARLLHELAYNCDHARPYHAAIDLRHALTLGAHAPAPTTTSART
uniref:Kinase n=1 Tax=Streptomyces dimorphogenes TaxID=2981601 RepID=A0A915YM32_9ACTN|nr:putative kinase [Streptomyces dimorphogenes]